MATVTNAIVSGGLIVRTFSADRQNAHAPAEGAQSEESQAALRQLSLERLMAYGVNYADAMELRGRVWSGEVWQTVATDLAETCLRPSEHGISPETAATRANRLFRASALMRMSQMMMLRNTAERSTIFAKAGQYFEEAAAMVGGRSRVVIETENGPLTGWLYPSGLPRTVGRAIVIGGVEGWAMDFADIGLALAARGVESLVLDGPGQGESRLVHGHFLSTAWERSYAGVFDYFEQCSAALPIAFVGNSMGGSFAMHLAAREPRIVACVSNGGTSAPALARGNATFFKKMAAHVGDVTDDEAERVWSTINPVDPNTPVRCPLLVVHGGQDPLISDKDAERMFQSAASEDKQMVVYSDGDHCIYNHSDDKHALIGDWVASHLETA